MVKPKPKSKRTPVRLRHKIEKASAAKQRKQRKLAKTNPQWRSRLKKDPGIPNLFPYKEKILQEIEEKKRLKEEEQAGRRKKGVQAQQGGQDPAAQQDTDETMEAVADADAEAEAEAVDEEMGEDDEDDAANPMAALVASARARAAEYEGHHLPTRDKMDEDEDEDEEDDGHDDDDDNGVDGEKFQDYEMDLDNAPKPSQRKDLSRRAFDKVFKHVVDAADVVLYVLDARDPEGTRSREVERAIMTADQGQKRLILILNKVDLVPLPVLEGWLAHLRLSFLTLPFRASGAAKSTRSAFHSKFSLQDTSSTLVRALKAYAHAKQLKRSITVGVIGYPNVGKSSVINALTSGFGAGPSSSACPVGAEAGVTTSMREVKLDRKLKLLDSPGIVFPGRATAAAAVASRTDEQARLILLNAVPPKQIDDPVPAVSMLLRRLARSPRQLQDLLDLYDLTALMTGANGDVTADFLVQVARKRGRLGKGGVPNTHSAAMTVITDWRDGRIHGWMEPPSTSASTALSGAQGASGPASADVVGQKEVVTEWAKEFQLEGLWSNSEVEAGGAPVVP
ncbi:MAG: hypothetical protein M1826_005464 [Phylliscum demangeonii]|nr:MAG: hypothetical protein M1826_005464 [Phylliscum demangeonii]